MLRERVGRRSAGKERPTAPQAPARSRCLLCSDPRFLFVTFGLLEEAQYGHFKEIRLSCCSNYVTFPSGAMIELLPRDYSTHSLNPTEAGKGPGVRLRKTSRAAKADSSCSGARWTTSCIRRLEPEKAPDSRGDGRLEEGKRNEYAARDLSRSDSCQRGPEGNEPMALKRRFRYPTLSTVRHRFVMMLQRIRSRLY